MTGQTEVISHDVHRAHVLEECLCGRGCQRRVQLEGKPFARVINDLMTQVITTLRLFLLSWYLIILSYYDGFVNTV